MSKQIAFIEDIHSFENLNIVSFDYHGTKLKMMSLELSQEMKVGTKVSLNMKPNAIAIGKNFSGMLSCTNQIKTVIDSIEDGKLLCSVKLLYAEDILESIVLEKDSLKKKELIELKGRMEAKFGNILESY